MLIVSHSVTIGSAAYNSAGHSRLITLRTNASLGTPVNSATITLAPPDDISVTPGDDVVIELGYDDSLSTVFTGLVESVDWAVEGVTIRAAGAFRGLISARFNSFFEKSKAGDIVSNVAGLLEVSTGNVESGLELPAFALSNGLNAYDALRGLAERCGFDFYADADDAVCHASIPSIIVKNPFFTSNRCDTPVTLNVPFWSDSGISLITISSPRCTSGAPSVLTLHVRFALSRASAASAIFPASSCVRIAGSKRWTVIAPLSPADPLTSFFVSHEYASCP